MHNGYQTRINLGIGIGMLLSLPVLLLVMLQAAPTAAFLLLLASIAAMCWGCAGFARAKGYHAALGLLAIIPPVGLLVLLLLPDRVPPTASASAASQAEPARPASESQSAEATHGA